MEGKTRWWQWAVMGAAVVAVGVSVWYSFSRSGSKVDFASQIIMADVTTGDLFSFDVGGRKAVMVPARNPDSGKLTLLPVERRPDGNWYIGERELGGLGGLEGEPLAVDRNTGQVRVTGDSPKRAS